MYEYDPEWNIKTDPKRLCVDLQNLFYKIGTSKNLNFRRTCYAAINKKVFWLISLPEAWRNSIFIAARFSSGIVNIFCFFSNIVFFGMVVLQQFFLFLRSLFAQYVNWCAHLETQCLFIDWKLTFVASRIQSDWLPSYLPIIVSIEIVCFCIVGLAVWRMVNRILRLVPPDPLVYVMPQFHVVRA